MMMEATQLVRVRAKRKVIYELSKPKVLAIIPHCPLCGGRHVHGWGTGPRVAHCDNVRGSYFLECRDAPTMMERLWTYVSPMGAKAQFWFELKIMLPVLYRLNAHRVWW